jgi:hypothetical protein
MKKETANIVEVDSESDSSQYSISIIKILILVLNSKGKKILKNTLIDCGATVSLIDPKTIKEEKFRTETTLQPYRLRQAFSNKIEVAIHIVKEYITILSKEFMLKKPILLLVASLNYSEIILEMLFFKQENIEIKPATRDLILLVQKEIDLRNESFKSNVRHYYLSNEVSGIRKASPL